MRSQGQNSSQNISYQNAIQRPPVQRQQSQPPRPAPSTAQAQFEPKKSVTFYDGDPGVKHNTDRVDNWSGHDRQPKPALKQRDNSPQFTPTQEARRENLQIQNQSEIFNQPNESVEPIIVHHAVERNNPLRLSKIQEVLHEDIGELEAERGSLPATPRMGEGNRDVEKFVEANTLTGCRESTYFGDLGQLKKAPQVNRESPEKEMKQQFDSQPLDQNEIEWLLRNDQKFTDGQERRKLQWQLMTKLKDDMEITMEHEASDNQRMNHISIALVGVNFGSNDQVNIRNTPNLMLGVKFSNQEQQIAFARFEQSQKDDSYFSISEPSPNVDYNFDCNHHVDVVDYYTSMYSGCVEVNVLNSDQTWVVASGKLNIRKNLRQGREQTCIAYKLPLFTQNQMFGVVYLIVRNNSREEVIDKPIITHHAQTQEFKAPPLQQQTSTSSNPEDADARKRQRVMRARQQTNQNQYRTMGERERSVSPIATPDQSVDYHSREHNSDFNSRKQIEDSHSKNELKRANERIALLRQREQELMQQNEKLIEKKLVEEKKEEASPTLSESRADQLEREKRTHATLVGLINQCVAQSGDKLPQGLMAAAAAAANLTPSQSIDMQSKHGSAFGQGDTSMEGTFGKSPAKADRQLPISQYKTDVQNNSVIRESYQSQISVPDSRVNLEKAYAQKSYEKQEEYQPDTQQVDDIMKLVMAELNKGQENEPKNKVEDEVNKEDDAAQELYSLNPDKAARAKRAAKKWSSMYD